MNKKILKLIEERLLVGEKKDGHARLIKSIAQKFRDYLLKLIEERLLVGEKRYGHENVTNDGRDFEKEALEEALDCAVYLAAKLIEINDRRLINIIKENKWEEQ